MYRGIKMYKCVVCNEEIKSQNNSSNNSGEYGICNNCIISIEPEHYDIIKTSMLSDSLYVLLEKFIKDIKDIKNFSFDYNINDLELLITSLKSNISNYINSIREKKHEWIIHTNYSNVFSIVHDMRYYLKRFQEKLSLLREINKSNQKISDELFKLSLGTMVMEKDLEMFQKNCPKPTESKLDSEIRELYRKLDSI